MQGKTAKYQHMENSAAITQVALDNYKAVALKHMGRNAKWFGSICGSLRKKEKVEHALASMKSVGSSRVEQAKYNPTARLLNAISYFIAEEPKRVRVNNPRVAGARSDEAILFVATGDRLAYGSYLADRFKPDYSAWPVSFSELKDVVDRQRRVSSGDAPISQRVSEGEDKTKENQGKDYLAQIKSYSNQQLRYRPDIPVAHGFHVQGARVTFTSFNPCGMYQSSERDAGDLQYWVLYVLLVYHAHDTRCPSIQYCPQQLDFHRWDVSYNSLRYAVVPFYAGHAPGRVTFATFELSSLADGVKTVEELTQMFYHGEARGFLKTSWQDTRARSKEWELLEKLHAQGYLPGLVRLRGKARDLDTSAISDWSDEEGIKRVREILHLRSVGEPLSQALTPRHLLYVMYDLVETLLAMFESGVLHRDVSWFNVLVNPCHFDDDDDKCGIQSIPTISGIMSKCGASTADSPFVHKRTPGDKNSPYESTVLLCDLDHSLDLSNVDQTPRRMKTGTPMFIAVECAAPEQARFNTDVDLVALEEALGAIEGDEQGKKAFDAAFPDGDNEFKKSLTKVLKEEVIKRRLAKKARDPRTQEKVSHQPYHDIESVFWVFLWAFARAKPRDKPRNSNVNDDQERVLARFNNLCKLMLHHVVADDSAEVPRAQLLYGHHLEGIFHPRLAMFERLFGEMSRYLSIPWHRYGPEWIDPRHAFVAFRRLILDILIRTDAKDLDIPLNTEEPRVTTALDEYLQKKNMTTQARSTTANAQPAALARELRDSEPGPSGLNSAQPTDPSAPPAPSGSSAVAPPASTSLASQMATSSSSSAQPSRLGKRKHEPTGSDDEEHPKKKNPPPPIDEQALAAFEEFRARFPSFPARIVDASLTEPPPPPPAAPLRKETASEADEYSWDKYGLKRSVHALRLKFWKDLELWFGRGTRQAVEK